MASPRARPKRAQAGRRNARLAEPVEPESPSSELEQSPFLRKRSPTPAPPSSRSPASRASPRARAFSARGSKAKTRRKTRPAPETPAAAAWDGSLPSVVFDRAGWYSVHAGRGRTPPSAARAADISAVPRGPGYRFRRVQPRRHRAGRGPLSDTWAGAGLVRAARAAIIQILRAAAGRPQVLLVGSPTGLGTTGTGSPPGAKIVFAS